MYYIHLIMIMMRLNIKAENKTCENTSLNECSQSSKFRE